MPRLLMKFLFLFASKSDILLQGAWIRSSKSRDDRIPLWSSLGRLCNGRSAVHGQRSFHLGLPSSNLGQLWWKWRTGGHLLIRWIQSTAQGQTSFQAFLEFLKFNADPTEDCICGLSKKGQRIVGGQEVTVDEWPWQVIRGGFLVVGIFLLDDF